MRRYEWGDYGIEEDGTVYEITGEIGPTPQVGEIPGFVAAEFLRLAARVQDLETANAELQEQRRFEADLFQKGPAAMEGVIADRTSEIRLLRRERQLLIDLDKARANLAAGMFHGEVQQSVLDEIDRCQAGVLALHAEARGGVLLPDGVPCGCLLCAPKRALGGTEPYDLGASIALQDAGDPGPEPEKEN
jgi:hypothetical protein